MQPTALLLAVLVTSAPAFAHESWYEAPGFDLDVPLYADACEPAPLPGVGAVSLSFYLGARGLEEEYWDPTEKQGVFGVEFSRQGADDFLGFELGIMGSTDTADVGAFDVRGSVVEIYAGLRKNFDMPVVGLRPYVGGGLAIVAAEAEASIGPFTDSVDDTSLAGYLHGGIVYVFDFGFQLGLDVRTLFGSELDIGPVVADADYEQVALVLGLAF